MNPRIKSILRATAWGVLLGFLVLGVGGRIIMRLIAHHAGLDGGFSWGGSLEVVLLGGITGAIAGVFYPIWQQIPTNQWIKGITYGAVVFLVFLILPISGKGAARGFPAIQVEIYLLFGVLFVVFGTLLASFSRRKIR